CEKSARSKYVRQLASHLSMALCIDPHAQSLVITLCDGNASNNFEALKCWIDKKLSGEIATQKASFWEGELAKVLDDVVWSA
ncbi:MAG: hypothetical protein MJK04_27020, partial [Psychrosphaera sp.]|nr:hypothetical protein [Psychrosphaera sp.]